MPDGNGAAPLVSGRVTQLVQANNWYVHYPDISGDHNNHLVVAFALLDDGNVVPLITHPDEINNSIVQASVIAANYLVLNPYSECPFCVRPPDASSSTG